MNRRDDLRGVQKRLREANQQLKNLAAQGGAAETTVQTDKRVDLEETINQLKLEQDVLRGLIKEDAEALRNQKDQERKDARAARVGPLFTGAGSGFMGSRLGDAPQIASAPVASKRPVQARYVDGQIDTTGLADNQTILRDDGTYGRFDIETGKITTVVFNPATDSFEVLDYKTPEGIARIKQRLASSMADVLNYAQEFGDTDTLARHRDLQRQIDAVDSNTSLRAEERDQALAELYRNNSTLFDTIDFNRVQSVQQQAQERLQQEALALAQEEEDYLAKMQSATAALSKDFDLETSRLEAMSDPTILSKENEEAYNVYKGRYEKYQEEFTKRLKALPEDPTDEQIKMAHVEAFVEAGFGRRGDAMRSSVLGAMKSPDQFAVERMKTNGMRKQNAEARVANTHLMKVTELEINALETGPLSTERYRAFIEAAMAADPVEDGNQRNRAERAYMRAVKPLMDRMRNAQHLHSQARSRISYVDFLEQHVAGPGDASIKNYDVMKTMQRLNAAGGNFTLSQVAAATAMAYSDQYNGQIAAAKHEAKVKSEERALGSGTAESRALQQDRRPAGI